MALHYNKDSRFVFVGDSFTSGRREDDPEHLGTSYVRLIRDYLRARHAPLAPEVINRAVFGNDLTEISANWALGVLAQRPAVISMMIDVNNAAGDGHATPSVEQFRTAYSQVLTQTLEQLPRVELVLCEPPALWSDVPVQADEVVRQYVDALWEVASEFNAVCTVPLHSALVFGRRARPDLQWVTDGHQATSSAHMLIATTWLESTGILERTST